MNRSLSFVGLLVLLGIAWLFSNNKKKLDARVILGGIALQFVLALLVLKTEAGTVFFEFLNDHVSEVINLSDKGAKFLFGNGFKEHFFAFKILPTIIFFSSLSYVCFYLGILQKVTLVLAWIMKRVMNISGAESLVTAINVFIGHTEAPLFVQPYLKSMTRSEIHTMMVGGMATVSGATLAAFVGFGVSAGHLVAASLMSAPAAIVIAKIMYPETEASPTMGGVRINVSSSEENVFEAACVGATQGLKLALNVGAMLIAFVSLIALANLIIEQATALLGLEMNFEQLLGYAFRPLAFLIGVPWDESLIVGQMLGSKIVINEFVAYIKLSEYINQVNGLYLSERSTIITTYALCGFANFSSIAIQIGGIGSLEPSRRKDFAKSGFAAMVGGTLAALMTGCIAGLLI